MNSGTRFARVAQKPKPKPTTAKVVAAIKAAAVPQPTVGWSDYKMQKVNEWGNQVNIEEDVEVPIPVYASHVTKLKDGSHLHVMFAVITKWADGGVKQIKYAGVLTRYTKLMQVSRNELRKTCWARLQLKPVKMEFSVPIPFSEGAGLAYVRNQIYRRGLFAKPDDDGDFIDE